MATASKLKPVDEWLDSVAGLTLHIGMNGGTKPISKEEVLALSDRCEYAEILTDHRLSGVHPKHLKIWRGDYLEWCRSGGQSEMSQVYFITATR